VAVAQSLHEQLRTRARAFLRETSGKTGLHILTPWKQDGGYDEARAWALHIAERVAQALPDQATGGTRQAKAAAGACTSM